MGRCRGRERGAFAVAQTCGAHQRGTAPSQPVHMGAVCRAPTTKPLKRGLLGGAACLLRAVAYWANAAKARAVMSSTLPVPLMARYLGAEAASVWAQLA